MKIRSGFVSNSSSASYVIRIKYLYFKEFCDNLIAGYRWSEFNKQELKAELQKRLESYKAAKKDNSKKNNRKVFFHGMYDDWIEETNHYLKRINDNKLSNRDFVKLVFKLRGITLRDNTKYDVAPTIELDCFTSMHNSFNEGMPDLGKEILLYFMSQGYEVELDMESDND